jgi:hypothetical protein
MGYFPLYGVLWRSTLLDFPRGKYRNLKITDIANVLFCINMMLPDSRISLYLHGIQDKPVSLDTKTLIFAGFSLLNS